MNGLENGERGRRGGRRLTHTLIAQWRLPSFLPSFSDAAFIAVAAWKGGGRDPRKIDLAPECGILPICPGKRGFLVCIARVKTQVCWPELPVAPSLLYV